MLYLLTSGGYDQYGSSWLVESDIPVTEVIWDLWAGLPTNLGGLQIAKEMMAREIGVGDGELFAFSKGLHLYDDTWEFAKQVVRL